MPRYSSNVSTRPSPYSTVRLEVEHNNFRRNILNFTLPSCNYTINIDLQDYNQDQPMDVEPIHEETFEEAHARFCNLVDEILQPSNVSDVDMIDSKVSDDMVTDIETSAPSNEEMIRLLNEAIECDQMPSDDELLKMLEDIVEADVIPSDDELMQLLDSVPFVESNDRMDE